MTQKEKKRKDNLLGVDQYLASWEFALKNDADFLKNSKDLLRTSSGFGVNPYGGRRRG
jgi:hypothetical protein